MDAHVAGGAVEFLPDVDDKKASQVLDASHRLLCHGRSWMHHFTWRSGVVDHVVEAAADVDDHIPHHNECLLLTNGHDDGKIA